jgi:hypothetical protein
VTKAYDFKKNEFNFRVLKDEDFEYCEVKITNKMNSDILEKDLR